MTKRPAIAGATALLIAAAGCNSQPGEEPSDAAPGSMEHVPVQLPSELADPGRAPDPHLLLPPLEGYHTDDEAEPGELEASLDHGSVPYAEVRRRLVLDEEGFTRAEVTVVTLRPGSDGVERFLAHHYGDVDRSRVQLAGVQMLRLAADPFPVLVWAGPNFVVTFARGQGVGEEWLQNLAAATVQAIAGR